MKRKLLDNWGIKLISILLALLLWVLVTLDREYTRRLPARLSLIDLPERLVLAGLLPSTIEVLVQTRGSDIIRLNLTRPEVEIPCHEMVRGDNEVELVPDYFHPPREIGVEVQEFRPKTLTVTLDQVTTGVKPVRARLVGDPKPGSVQVGRARLEPDKIEVTGPESVVSKLDTVWTEPIQLSNADMPIIIHVRVNLEELFPNLDGRPDSVTAFVEIEPVKSRDFADLPVEVDGRRASARIRVEPPRLTVTLSGAESVVDEVSPEKIRAVINAANLRPGAYNLPARIYLPRGLSLVAAEPQTFRVTIE